MGPAAVESVAPQANITVQLQPEKTATVATDTNVPSKPEPVAKAEIPTSVPVSKSNPRPLTEKELLMTAAGIPRADWAATDYIVFKESSWNPTARNPESGAFGLCQALPASKMASAGIDYMTNPVTQLKWCHSYAHHRYGGWWASFAFWQSNRWW